MAVLSKFNISVRFASDMVLIEIKCNTKAAVAQSESLMQLFSQSSPLMYKDKKLK